MTPEQILATLANRNRLRCLYLVVNSDEVCVCEILDCLDISQPTISKSLAALREAGFLQGRRDANWNYYRRATSMPAWQARLLDSVISGLSQEATYQADWTAFARRPARARRVNAGDTSLPRDCA